VLGHSSDLGFPVADPFVLHKDWLPALGGLFDPVCVRDLFVSWHAVVLGEG
jgi:hypothetical protein